MSINKLQKIATGTTLLCLLLLVSGQEVKADTVSNDSDHFSFDLPVNWGQLSQDKLSSLESKLDSGQGLGGGYSEQLNDGSTPTLVIMSTPVSAGQYPQNIDDILNGKTSANSSSSDYNQILQSFNLDESSLQDSSFSYNPDRKYLIFQGGQSESSTLLHDYFVVFFGKEKMVFFFFSTLDADFAAQKDQYNQIIDSFQWDSGYEYSQTDVSLAHIWEYGGGFGLIALGLIFRRRKVSKNKYV